MKITRRSLVFFLGIVLTASALSAATFIVPTDEELIDVSKGIVRGVAIDSYGRRDALGRIETVYRLAVDEVLKGMFSERVIEIVQLGGRIGDEFLVVSGSPHYRSGVQYVVFLAENREGSWTTRDFTLGAFELVNDGKRPRYARNMHDVGGWSRDGGPIVEPLRDADEFLQRIRARVHETRGRAVAATITPAALDMDLRAATGVGAAAWTNDGASDVNYSVSPTSASGNTQNEADGEDRVIPDDPQGLIPGTFTGSGTVGICFFGGFIQNNNDTDGETYSANITGADVVINDGVMSSNIGGTSNFNSVLTHEIGHSLAFRHADGDRGASQQNTCAAPLPCSTSAIMTAFVTSGLNGALQAWDTDGVRKVYGTVAGGTSYVYSVSGGTTAWRRANPTTAWRIVSVSCTAVAISGHPLSTSVDSGSGTTLSVSVTGTGPFTYQWFRGASGNTSDPINGATSSSLNTGALTTTTSFWVRVTNCSGASTANSNAATVTVNACTAPTISQQPFASPSTINPGISSTLSVSSPSSGVTYQWFVGNPGTTTSLVSGATSSSVSVAPTTTTTYWVRLSRCAPPLTVDSQAVTVTVVPCEAPTINAATPADASVVAGGSTTLTVLHGGTPPSTYQWFRGAAGVTTAPVGTNSPSFTTPALSSTTQFWVRVTNCGGPRDSRVATVSVTACNAAQITTQPQSTTVQPGGSATLTATATGTSLSFQWFRGQSGDQSNPIAGATGASLNTGALQQTTSFWVKVTSNCGSFASVNSQTATVTVSQCSITITTQPQGASGFGGTAPTLRVVATASPSSATLTYQWFKGVAGQPSTPIAGATSSTFNTGPLVATTSFFVRVNSSCGASVNSATATVTINVRRSKRPGRRR